MHTPLISRRRLLGASLAAGFANLSVAGTGRAGDKSDKRFVFVLLRGGMDGLAAVPALGDPAFAAARGPLADYGVSALTLDADFAMHPNLAQLHGMYLRGEAAVVHAVGLPYRERSHFDAQQLLESGGSKPYELQTGWLGRALASTEQRGVAINTAVPLLLRGCEQIDSWAPSALPEPGADLVARLHTLYRADPALGQALARARDLRNAPSMTMAGMAPPPNPTGAVALARKAAELLLRPGGSQVAVLELGGWDSHANQSALQGALANNMRTLDAMLAALREMFTAPEAADAWSRTVVVVASEFGREVAVNGTLGTDHGSGGVAFVLGGAVKGGSVHADWPGLAPAQRFEGRDLKTTTDMRAVLRPIMARHLGVSTGALGTTVFPGSAGLREIDLLRG